MKQYADYYRLYFYVHIFDSKKLSYERNEIGYNLYHINGF